MIKLNELELDALGEIFNHGVGQAAHALSQLAGENVSLTVPRIESISKRELTRQLNSQGAGRICAVRQEFSGVVNTDTLLMFPFEHSLRLVQMIIGNDIPLEQVREMEQESLSEIGNILLNSVVASVADMLLIEFEGGLPTVEVGEVSAVLCSDGSNDDLVLSLQINFEIASREIQGYLVFLLDLPSSETLMTKIASFIDSLK